MSEEMAGQWDAMDNIKAGAGSSLETCRRNGPFKKEGRRCREASSVEMLIRWMGKWDGQERIGLAGERRPQDSLLEAVPCQIRHP